MTDEPDKISDEQPRATYRRFESETEFQAAVDDLLETPGRELRVFDPDLRALRVDRPERIARLSHFLTVSRTRRIQIVVHDPGPLTRHYPRMMELLARYSHAIQVNRTHDEVRHLQDAFLVLDAHSYVRRPVARFFRGAIGIQDETEALVMRSRFTEIWSASYPGVSGSTLGL